MYSKKFVYSISAVMLLIGIVAHLEDVHAAQRVKATAELASFNQAATGVLNGQYMLIQPTASDVDMQGGQYSDLQDTSSVWVQQAQTMYEGNASIQGNRATLQSAYVNANQ